MNALPGLVIFDLDGTLADTLPATYRCFAEAVAPALGRRPTDEEIRARMGGADQEIIARWAGPEHAADAVARLYACYERELTVVRPIEGIPELLRDLAAGGRRVALFTGRGRPSTDRLLASLGLDGLFPVTLTGEEAGRPKPAPDGILAVAATCGTAPADAVYVGDSPLDIASARAAGAQAIGVLWATREEAALRASGAPLAATVDELRGLLLGA